MRSLVAVLVLVLLSCAGPAGPKGATGPAGAQGPQGSKGDPGAPASIVAAPIIASISPGWGSGSTHVVLTGSNFSATAADDLVRFGGASATVLQAAPDRLVVEPSIGGSDPEPVAVTVEVDNEVSNPVIFQLVSSGTAVASPSSLPMAPAGVVRTGTGTWIASADLFGTSAGLYQVGSDGILRRALASRSFTVEQNGQPMRVFDAPIALATDGTDVWFTTALGELCRFQPATGTVTELWMAGSASNSAFPRLSGLARDAHGFLYLVDRGQGAVERIAPDGSVLEISDPSFANAWGIAAAGSSVYVSLDDATGGIARIASAEGTPQVDATFASGADGPRGIAATSSQVIVSQKNGVLLACPPSGGTLSPTLDPGGYVYRAEDLWAGSDGTLLLGQPDGMAVREVQGNDVSLVAVGLQATFASAVVGDDVFLAMVGPAVLSSGPPPIDDSVVVQLSPDGSSRIITEGRFFLGLVAGETGVIVSDCLARKIRSVDLGTGTSTDLLTAADGLTCPTGLARDAAGDLFYLDSALGGAGSATVGRKSPSGNDPVFITGLPGFTLSLAVNSGGIYLTGPAFNGPQPIFQAPLTGGAATVLVPASVTRSGLALGMSPTDALFLSRADGTVVRVEPGTGAVEPFGFSLTGAVSAGSSGGAASLALSMAFKDDGTLILPDYAQRALIVMAP